MNSTDLKSQLRELYISGAKVLYVIFWTMYTLQSFYTETFQLLLYHLRHKLNYYLKILNIATKLSSSRR